MIKWFATIIGAIFLKIPGAILGFLIGSLLDNLTGKNNIQVKEIIRDYTNQSVSPADFELNLLRKTKITK